MVREGDEVGHHTQQAVWEELLVRGHSSRDFILKDGDVHENLGDSGGGGVSRLLSRFRVGFAGTVGLNTPSHMSPGPRVKGTGRSAL